MAGKFECYRDKAGEYRFRLKAANSQVVLSSEGYSSKDRDCFERKTTASGKYRFSLKSTNGQVIGTSQNYKSDSGCRNGIAAVARAAKGATIVEV